MNKNILISSAGKRVELLKEFQKELKLRFPDGKIIAVDLNPKMAPACYIADEALPVSRVTNQDFISELLTICKEKEVGIVVPTIDTELIPLAENRSLFSENGIEILVSDADFIRKCRDKRLTNEVFASLGIRTPAPRDKHNPVYPMFAKPYDGSLSTNLHVIRSEADLTEEVMNDPKLIFMEFVDKSEYKEFTVDMYFGKDHKLKGVVPRERLEIRSGEINKGIALKNGIVDAFREKFDYMPGVRGCICVQVFFRESDGDIIGIEINPRFGGGYPLSYYSGANFPAMAIKEYIRQEPLDYRDDWRDGTIMLRYDSQVIV